ncbi:MAG: MaoC family dehydratase [Acidimicrobiia bacterium]|nr:MAG: MaoC family dehydratase [Acidimicrobiia bacterium]
MPVVPLSELENHIGEETGRSDWFTIDQDRIDAFAEATMDHQWIHVDPDAAAQGPFGKTIAHGFLTQSLLSYLTLGSMLLPDGAVMYINYGSDKVRFLNPVTVDSRVRTVSVLKDVKEKSPGQILVTNSVTVEIEGQERPALVAELLTLAVMAESS